MDGNRRTKRIPFTKLHGIGNDYIYISSLSEDEDFFDLSGIDLGKLAWEVCRYHFGIGGDGLILVLPSDKADFRMRIFNPDGSEAEMCGNGIRGFAKYVYDRGFIKDKKIRVETHAGIIIPEITGAKDGKARMIRVDMGEPILESKRIPVELKKNRVINEKILVDDQELYITCVSMGNPHCVLFADKGEAIDTESGHKVFISTTLIRNLGPRLERFEIFPGRINVHFVRVLNEDELEMRTWERGVGETLACGTGACAALVAGVLNKRTERQAKIHLLGGDLLTEWDEDNHVYMEGPAEESFRGQVET